MLLIPISFGVWCVHAESGSLMQSHTSEGGSPDDSAQLLKSRTLEDPMHSPDFDLLASEPDTDGNVEWEYKPQQSQNLCIAGHLAPELLIIGAEKAATSSFTDMVQTHPEMVLPEQPLCGIAELHIFDVTERFEKGPGFWLSNYPECPNTRKVAVDKTPSYLWQDSALWRMKEFYGDTIRRVKFVVILRKPLDRIHSAFHFYDVERYKPCPQEILDRGFKAYVQGVLDSASDPCQFVRVSDYAPDLERYLREFDESQLIVIPFREAIASSSSGRNARVSELWESLGLSGRQAPHMSHTNVNKWKTNTSKEELGEELWERFDSYLDDKMGPKKIAKLLAKHKVTLFGYGHTGLNDQDALAEFFEREW